MSLLELRQAYLQACDEYCATLEQVYATEMGGEAIIQMPDGHLATAFIAHRNAVHRKNVAAEKYMEAVRGQCPGVLTQVISQV